MASRDRLTLSIVVGCGIAGALLGHHQSVAYLASLGEDAWAGDGLSVTVFPMVGGMIGLGVGGIVAFSYHRWQRWRNR